MNDPRVALFLPSLEGGGTERVYVQLANEFARQGLRVDLVVATASGPYLGEVASSVRVVDCRARRVARALPRLALHLRRERCTAVLSALEHANVVALGACAVSCAGVRSVVSTRGVPTMLDREAGSMARWVLRAARVSYPFADSIVANSNGVADDMSHHFGIARANIQVIYNPLDLDLIEAQCRQPLTHPFFSPGEPPVLLSAGRLSPLKDFPTLLRAFARLRREHVCRLVILGDGPDRGALEGLVGALGLGADVALPGFDPNPFAWMRRAALFVSSSISEGCPNALMQALACGTPVVSTRAVGGSAEILDGGRWGRLVEVGDPAALAIAMKQTLRDAQRPDTRVRARDFELPRVARQYLELLLPGEYAASAV